MLYNTILKKIARGIIPRAIFMCENFLIHFYALGTYWRSALRSCSMSWPELRRFCQMM